MKRLLPLLLLLACAPEFEIPYVEGTWIRDHYKVTDFPDGFKYYEGREFQSLFGDYGYTLSFDVNHKFTRQINYGFNEITKGTWQIAGQELRLRPDQMPQEDYIIEEAEAGRLTLTKVFTFTILPDAVLDTLSDRATYDSVAPYFKDVDAKVWTYFER